MILDVWDAVYIWVGSGANQQEKKIRNVEKYLFFSLTKKSHYYEWHNGKSS
jgi:hypothetical protein